MPGLRRHQLLNRQIAAPTGSGIGGTLQITGAISPTQSLILDPNAASASVVPPTLLFTVTVTSSATSSPQPTSTSDPSTSSEASGQQVGSSSHSQIPISTVIAACVGAFVGLAILIGIFWWWYKRPSSKSRQPRSPVADTRNARGEVDQRRARGRSWNKLDDEDQWEGQKVEMKEKEKGGPRHEDDEKNFPMFKKTNSMRTTRTAKALEEHGFDLPAFEFSKYHPSLAEELALEQPNKPYTQRQDSGVSWDGDTIADDSFLSMRASGAMSPNIAKMTPPASFAPVHKWESAEVITMDTNSSQAENPFSEPSFERRASRTNPFFSASDLRHTQSVRSRSNSYGSHSRNASRASRTTTRSRARSDAGEDVDPFDEATPLPRFRGHVQTDSTATTSSGDISEHAMQSLIAALDLTPEQVQERIRVASMQPSMSSRYSTIAESAAGDTDTVRGVAVGPVSPVDR